MGLIDNNSVSFRDASFYSQKEKAEIEAGRKLTREEFIKDYYVPAGGGEQYGTNRNERF